jgi:hypothetical protein
MTAELTSQQAVIERLERRLRATNWLVRVRKQIASGESQEDTVLDSCLLDDSQSLKDPDT